VAYRLYCASLPCFVARYRAAQEERMLDVAARGQRRRLGASARLSVSFGKLPQAATSATGAQSTGP
jgi:hypothetical protein